MAGITTIGDVFNAATGFAVSVSEERQRIGREIAQHDLNEMQAQFDVDANNFLLKLSQSNSYDTWDKDLDAFMQETKGKLKQKPGDGEVNSYYCRNQFTADKANEMLTGQRASLVNKINIMKLEKQQDEMRASSARTKALYRENPGLNYQQKTDKMNRVTDGDFVGGRIKNYSEYQATILNEASSNYAENRLDEVQNLIDQNASWEEIKAYVENTKTGLNVSILAGSTSRESFEDGTAAYKDISDMIDTNEIDKNVMKQKKADWEAHRKDVWNSNESNLNTLYTRMLSSQNESDRTALARQGLNIMKNQYKANKDLSNEKHKFWTDQFESELASIAKGKSGSGSGSTSLPSFESYVKNYPDQAIEQIANGTMTDSYAATQAMQNLIEQDYFSNDWKETKGMTAQEKQEYYEKSYKNMAANELLNNKRLKTMLENNPEFATLNVRYKKFLKDLEADAKIKDPKKRKYDADAARYIASFVYDAVAGSGKNTDYNELSKQLEAQLNACEVSSLEKMFKNTDKDMVKAVKTLQENDFVHTDVNGKDQWVPGAQEKVDAIRDSLKSQLAGVLGVDEAEISASYKESRTDKDSKPVFTVNKVDYEYQVDPEDKNNYIIVGSNGEVINLKKQDAEEKKAAKNKNNATRNEHYEMNKRREKEAEGITFAQLKALGLADSTNEHDWDVEMKDKPAVRVNYLQKHGYKFK